MNFQSLRFKMVATLGFLSILMIGSITIACLRVQVVNNALQTINNVNSVKQRQAINFRGSVHDRSILIRDLVLFDHEADINQSVREIIKLEKAYDTSRVVLDKMLTDYPTDEEVAAYTEIERIESETMPLVATIIKKR